MNVNLGTLEVTEEDRRRITGSGRPATREEVRDWAFTLLINMLDPTKKSRKAKAARRRLAGEFTEFEKALRKRR